MAKPRIFVSSTYYNLKSIRSDLAKFVKEELGYEHVLHERGEVTYTKDEELEKACYREISSSDIIVAIIGSNFGSESNDNVHSISQMELKTAIEQDKQVYVFVEKNVLSEFETFKLNRDNDEIKYKYVDDTRIYQFLESIKTLTLSTPISPFETFSEIKSFLREQLAGILKHLLDNQSRQREVDMLDKMQSTAKTLNDMVKFLKEQKEFGEEALKNILTINYPAFNHLQSILGVEHRILFTNFKELDSWLEAQGFERIPTGNWDDPNIIEWERERIPSTQVLKIHRIIFDSNKNLKVLDTWNDNWIHLDIKSNEIEDDDLPF